MRYPKDQKERTRRHIVETASGAIRRDGIDASAIVPLMKAAGLTQGAFYKNFASRDELIAEALGHATAQTRKRALQWAAAGRAALEHPVARIIDEYLSERHLDALERSCAIAALGSELGRQAAPVRRIAYAGIVDMADILALDLPAPHRHLAQPLFIYLAATLASARLASTREEQIGVLSVGRAAARTLAGLDQIAV